jgi:hypothetical protein
MQLHALCCAFGVGDFLAGLLCFLWAVVRIPNGGISCLRVHIFRLRFPYESLCFLLHNLLMRFHTFGSATRFV